MRSLTWTKGRAHAWRPRALRTEGTHRGLPDGRAEPPPAARKSQLPEPAFTTPGNCGYADQMEGIACRDAAGFTHEDDRDGGAADGAMASLPANADGPSSTKRTGQNLGWAEHRAQVQVGHVDRCWPEPSNGGRCYWRNGVR